MDVFRSAKILEALLLSTPIERSVIEEIDTANRILANQQVLNVYGDVSIRHPGNPHRFLLQRAFPASLVTGGDIVEYDLDGNAFGARPGFDHCPERFLHSEIYRMRADVNAVVHVDSPAVIPFSTTNILLRPMLYLAAFLAPHVPVFDIRQTGRATNLFNADPNLGQSLAATLGQYAVALMRGHGAVIVGPSLPLAVIRAVYTAINARMQMHAMAAGGAITFLNLGEAKEANKLLDTIHMQAWQRWKRSLQNDNIASDSVTGPLAG